MVQSSWRAALVTTILIFGLALAAANALGIALLAEHFSAPDFSLSGAGFAVKIAAATETMRARFPSFFWLFFILPLALFAFTALLVWLRLGRPPAPGESALAPSTPIDETERLTPALQMLALLQQEGRLVDFLQEDIGDYSDEQVGAAARTIHSGCRKALLERMDISRIFDDDDGATVEIAADYDANEVRLSGNVHGDPPFRGSLEHGGWRVSNVKLPEQTGGDPAVVAPAEVEIA